MCKKLLALALAFLLCFLYYIPVYAEKSQSDLVITDSCKGFDANEPYLGTSQLVENVEAAFLYEINSDSLLYAWEADTPQYPASLVKIMTALLVLENGDLSDIVTVSQSALDSVSYDAISVDLLAGEQITVEDLMYCMMVKSANDAAVVLAEYVSGSQTEFVNKMNIRASELGCTGTHYVNASGLHDDEQVTTARDTCRILREALQHEFFRTVFGTAHYTVSATNLSEERVLSTNNFLMNAESVGIYFDTRVIGGRTGVTSDGYRCIASVAHSGSMEVICVVMGSASTFAENGSTEVYGGFPETIELYDLSFEGNSACQIIFENQVLRQQSVLNGDCDVFMISRESFSTILPDDYTLDDLTFVFSDTSLSLEAPIEKGQKMGSVKIYCDDVCVAETDLYAANSVAIAYSKSGVYRDPVSGGFWWIAIVIVILLVVAAVLILWKRGKFPKLQKSKMQPWRMEE